MKLMTIGYEGLSLDAFFQTLRAAGVETITDVRQNPISRKKGFSKTALAAAACANGFRYVHLAEFGCPKAIRDQYRSDGDWERYTRDYLSHLQTLDISLVMLARQASQTTSCLLCFEADPATCHRSFVADRVTQVSDAPISVLHLGQPVSV